MSVLTLEMGPRVVKAKVGVGLGRRSGRPHVVCIVVYANDANWRGACEGRRGAGRRRRPEAAVGFYVDLTGPRAPPRYDAGMCRCLIFAVSGVLTLAGCGEPCGAAPAPAEPRTITVAGDAEIMTAPDRFIVTVGFDLQANTLGEARDGSQQRATALLAVAAKNPSCEVQTGQLSLQPRYEGYNEPGGRRIVGYQATRSLTVTLDALEQVEPLLFDMLAAGANRVDGVDFESSVLLDRRSEARLLAVEAARTKAVAMAAALGQTLGEPLKIEEAGPAPGWQPSMTNYVVDNATTPPQSETVATGKIRVHAGVSVVFALRPA